MSETFAAIARSLAPVAAQFLGWRPDEFWRSTPEELALCLADPTRPGQATGLSRDDLQRLLERDDNG